MDALLHDVKYAVRSLRKSPGFACAAIATMALGIGATTAIFSTVNAALLRPLAFPNPNDLYTLRTAISTGRMTSGMVAPVELTVLNEASGPVLHATGEEIETDTILDDGAHPLQINLAGVTDGFFETFNAPMRLGRSFTMDEAPHAGHPGFAVVLSAHLWRTAFNSDATIVGRSIQFSRGLMPVVGVASPAFDGITDTDVWFPAGFNRRNLSHIFRGYVRTRPGTTSKGLQNGLAAVLPELAKESPVFEKDRIYVHTLLTDTVLGDLKPTLLIAFGATALLLLIACVNVTNLLLARGSVRIRELAVRAALGAGRGALMRQLLTESVVLSLAGGLFGLVLARVGVQVLLLVGESHLPRLDHVEFDARVLTFAFVLTAVTGVAAGLLPALRLLTTDALSLMSDGGRLNTAGRRTHRALGTMIVLETALAVALVAGAGWLVRNYQNLEAVRPGFATEHRLAVDLLLPLGRYRQSAQTLAWTHTLLDRLRGLNGVEAAGASSSMPLRAERDQTINVTVAGEPEPYFPPAARLREVTPGWFEAMGIPPEAGRFFASNEPAPAFIVNETFVRQYLAGTDPLRQRLVRVLFGDTKTPRPEIPIIGVVADVKYASLQQPPEPTIYSSVNPIRRQTIVIRSSLNDPAALIPLVRREVQQLDPQVPLDFELLPDVVSASLSRQRLGMVLMLLFGTAALTLAAVGIYGVIAYAVSQRVREMATRLALGASPQQVFWLTMRGGQTMALIGIVIGVAMAYAGGRLLASSLYEVRAADPLILLTATGLVFAFALLAAFVPSRRAARVDPMLALRAE